MGDPTAKRGKIKVRDRRIQEFRSFDERTREEVVLVGDQKDAR